MDDLIDGLIKLMNSPDDFTGPVNLGNPVEFSILELAEKVIELVNSTHKTQHLKSKIVYKPLPQDDPVRRKPDISLAMDRLNWNPETGLEEGLKETIEYFRILTK